MDFSFNADQTSLGETVARMLADHPDLLAPEPLPAAQDSAREALAGLGLFALLVPESHGGAGLSLVDLAPAVEALGAGLAPPAAVATLAATDLLVRHGSHAQQAAWLSRIASGTVSIGLAVLEADRGYDPRDAGCSHQDGVLSGTKILVEGAARADLLIVLAQSANGPALLLVERAAPGVTLRRHDDIDAGSGFCAVTFDAVRLDENAVLGSAAPGSAIARLFDVGPTLGAGLLTGIAARMLETSVEYAKNRQQFGQVIGGFQAIKHRCADMAVALEAARSAAYYAFWAISEDAPDVARAASMAKSCCGESARSICNETIQIHGGMGFTWELGLHRFLRRARVLEYGFGDGPWHNERVLAETLAMLSEARNESALAAQ
jgi:alkylation response protein AidB-like acyl-CoA dehydrogenase